jgi:hypothetical protein
VAAVEAGAAPVQAPVQPGPAPIKAHIGTVARDVQPQAAGIPSPGIGPVRALVEVVVDAITALVKLVLDAVAAQVQALLDAGTALRAGAGGGTQ